MVAAVEHVFGQVLVRERRVPGEVIGQGRLHGRGVLSLRPEQRLTHHFSTANDVKRLDIL